MNHSQQRRIAYAAVLVTGLFALSRVLGLVRTMVLGYYFGTGSEMDAYNYASRIPELLFNVVAGGALGSAFIPIFTGRLSTGDEAGAWRLVSALVNLIFILLTSLSLLTIAFAAPLVSGVIAPEAAPDIQARAALLLRVMALSPAIFGVSGIVMGALNGCQHFLLPALAPLFYNAALIIGAIWGGLTGRGTLGAAIGAVIGAALHLLAQLPGLARYQARYTPTFGLDDAGVRQVGLLMLPRVFGVAAVQFNFVITNNLASGLEAGAVSMLAYAWMLVLLPNVLAQAVGTTVFPTFSAQAARGELAELRQSVFAALRAVVAFMLPSALGLMLLGRPLVTVAFERGAFAAGSTEGVVWALACFAVGLVGHGGIEVLARAFYAVHDTWTPALVAAGAMLANVALGLLLPPLFAQVGLPAYGGLALANGLAVLLEFAALWRLVGRRIGAFSSPAGFIPFGKMALAGGGMALLLWLWLRVSPPLALLQSIVGIALGGAGYGVLALLLRMEELPQLQQLLRRKGQGV